MPASDDPAPEPVDQSGPEVGGRLRYRLLTGTDDRAFCERVSHALAEGYVLHGSPAVTFDGERTVTAQAVVLPGDAGVGGVAAAAGASGVALAGGSEGVLPLGVSGLLSEGLSGGAA